MPHFYVNPQNITNNTFTIKDEQFHYLSNVRRFSVDDEINIFDGLGNCYRGKITSVDKKSLSGVILSTKTSLKADTEIVLYTAIPKGERFDWLIEKASEIGVSKIVPIIYLRSVVTDFSANKLERYKKISVSASSQSWRADIMEISSPMKFSDAVNNVCNENNLNVLPYESEENNKIFSVLQEETKNNKIKNINIFIGPEGGFDSTEIDLALNKNFKIVTLGKNILRIETAAIVAASCCQLFDKIK
ncbi:MAG: 16S rRNA (uracil(1498)-N(3))-methyltransferase [Elusimicrobia bacterium]|nr:16S rRNA (uracil(1498)-N(3))-methyltransferase [Elusimicrobiota bacterium]